MEKRAEQINETRRRIVEATVQLHERLGPAATTIAAIAEAAGVTRLTVYRHFPDDQALFAACSAHWMAGQVMPDPASWASVGDPAERLRAGLTDLYRHYRRGQAMLSKVFADKEALPEPNRRQIDERQKQHVAVLLAAFPSDRRGPLLRAVVGHSVSFSTWRSLCVERQLSNRDAVELMTSLALLTWRSA